MSTMFFANEKSNLLHKQKDVILQIDGHTLFVPVLWSVVAVDYGVAFFRDYFSLFNFLRYWNPFLTETNSDTPIVPLVGILYSPTRSGYYVHQQV